MSEKIDSQASHEGVNNANELPSMDELVDSMQERRRDLSAQIDEAVSRPGFKFSNGQYEKDRLLSNLRKQLDVVETEWNRLGGEDIDKAQEAVDNAPVHIERFYKKKDLQDAKQAFYDRFRSEQLQDFDKKGSVESAETIARENARKLVEGGHIQPGDVDEYVQNEVARISGHSEKPNDNAPLSSLEQDGAKGDIVQQAAALMSEASGALNDPNVAPEDKQRVLGAVQEILNNLKTAGDGAEGSQTVSSSPEGASGEKNDEEDPGEGVEARLEAHMQQVHQESLKEYSEARRAFLEIAARNQKGHWRRIRPGGTTERFLRALPGIGHKLAEYFTKPTKEEAEAGAAYEAALAKIDTAQRVFLSNEVSNGTMTPEDFRANRAAFINGEDAGNFMTIAEMQKATDKKPLSKWLRRTLYGAAGVGGGLVALLNLPVGLAVAGVGAGAARVWANKRNAKLEAKTKDGAQTEYVVDRVADGYHARFKDMMASKRYMKEEAGEAPWEPDAGDVVQSVYDATANEIGKNRNRLVWPFVGAAAVAAVTKYGIEFANSQLTQAGEHGRWDEAKIVKDDTELDKKVEPPVVEDESPVSSEKHFSSFNTNQAPESIVKDQLESMGYSFDGDPTEFLKNAKEAVGAEDGLMVTQDGSPVDMYLGGSGDVRAQAWDQDLSVRFSDELIDAIKAGKVSLK